MELKAPSSNVPRYRPVISEVTDNSLPGQADLLSAAVRRAAGDASAAIAHQLSEPLSSLLLYLHDLRKRCDLIEKDPDTFRDMVDTALRATERTREILEVACHKVAALDIGSAVAPGSEAVDPWKRNSVAATSAPAALICKHPLTARELEVLTLITEGLSNKRGSHRLGISTRTFEVHRAHVMRKLGAKNAADLMRIVLGGT